MYASPAGPAFGHRRRYRNSREPAPHSLLANIIMSLATSQPTVITRFEGLPHVHGTCRALRIALHVCILWQLSNTTCNWVLTAARDQIWHRPRRADRNQGPIESTFRKRQARVLGILPWWRYLRYTAHPPDSRGGERSGEAEHEESAIRRTSSHARRVVPGIRKGSSPRVSPGDVFRRLHIQVWQASKTCTGHHFDANLQRGGAGAAQGRAHRARERSRPPHRHRTSNMPI